MPRVDSNDCDEIQSLVDGHYPTGHYADWYNADRHHANRIAVLCTIVLCRAPACNLTGPMAKKKGGREAADAAPHPPVCQLYRGWSRISWNLAQYTSVHSFFQPFGPPFHIRARSSHVGSLPIRLSTA